jgi:hypothetical protein
MSSEQINKLISEGFIKEEVLEKNKNPNLKKLLTNPFIIEFIKAGLKVDEVKDISENAVKALENQLIQKALLKKEISLKTILDVSDHGLEALGYPSIIKCIANKLRVFRLYAHKCSIEKILKIKSKEELKQAVLDHQKMIKKNPLSFFFVPSELQDEIHEMKSKFLSK